MENIINLVMTLFNIVWLHFFKKQRCSCVTTKSSLLTLIELLNFNIFHVRNPRCPRVDLTLPDLFWVYIHLYTAFWIKKNNTKTHCESKSLLTKTNLVQGKKDFLSFSGMTACSIVLLQTPGHPSRCLEQCSPHCVASLPHRIAHCRATN